VKRRLTHLGFGILDFGIRKSLKSEIRISKSEVPMLDLLGNLIELKKGDESWLT